MMKLGHISFTASRSRSAQLVLDSAFFSILIISLTSCHPTKIQSSPAPGTMMTSAKDNMVMLYVPAGSFTMGSAADDHMASPDESPQHQVYLDAFWIDQTEVSNAMFATFLNEIGNQKTDGKTWLNMRVTDSKIVQKAELWQPKAEYENHPVVNVTWHGAQAYCDWAKRRLPTEAEWEKAARGTEGGLYPWGDGNPTCELANYDGGYCMLRHTMPVGSYPKGQSPYGALDMSGNVWELVADYYAFDYYANSPKNNPTGPVMGDSHVVRGSSFYVHQYDIRSARRGKSPSSGSSPYVGFRCALSATE
jgi:formylglycine-generating enzyme required for sulfatase activity